MASNHITLNCKGKLLDLSTPRVMGILNATPDSFYEGSRVGTDGAVLRFAEKMVEEGVDILDIGGQSTRPGAADVGIDEELKRVLPVVKAVTSEFPDLILSVDTYHSKVANEAVDMGAALINDVSGGSFDTQMFETVAQCGVPYVLMHTSGRPDVMQQRTGYGDIVADILSYLSGKIADLHALGVCDVVIDVGFGFGKTLEQNYDLLMHLDSFKVLKKAILVGISRKSMIGKVLLKSPVHALSGTTAAHMLALQGGAHILRVHDVEEARDAIKIFSFAQSCCQA